VGVGLEGSAVLLQSEEEEDEEEQGGGSAELKSSSPRASSWSFETVSGPLRLRVDVYLNM